MLGCSPHHFESEPIMRARLLRKLLPQRDTGPLQREVSTWEQIDVGLPVTPAQHRAVQASQSHHPRSLTALADTYRSDKGSSKHEYTRLYELLFHGFRIEPIKLVELGLLIGGPEHGASETRQTDDVPSVRMWLEYFPQAEIIGSDISDFGWFEHDRFKFVQCDMSERQNFAAVSAASTGAKVIIDDASHASAHQQFGLLELFPVLEPEGIYIIEDLQWQPDVYERLHPGFPTTSNLFRGFIRDRFFEHPDRQIEDELNTLAESFACVLLFQDHYLPYTVDKVAVIHKKP